MEKIFEIIAMAFAVASLSIMLVTGICSSFCAMSADELEEENSSRENGEKKNFLPFLWAIPLAQTPPPSGGNHLPIETGWVEILVYTFLYAGLAILLAWGFARIFVRLLDGED